MGLFSNRHSDQEIENLSIKRLIPKCQEWKIDTLMFSTYRNCSFCKKYNFQIFSLYGWNKQYPKVPAILKKRNALSVNILLEPVSIFLVLAHCQNESIKFCKQIKKGLKCQS